MALQGPTQGPPTIALPQAPAGVPSVLDTAVAEKYRSDVIKAYDINAAAPADVAEASRYIFELQCARHSASTPAGPPILIPGAPAWAQTLSNNITQNTTALAQNTTALAQNTAALNALTTRVTLLEHSLSTARTLALLRNGSCTEPNSPLHPVPHKSTGTMPPAIFPRTLRAFNRLVAPRVNQLLTFYGLPVNGTVAQKRARLKTEIGILLPAMQ